MAYEDDYELGRLRQEAERRKRELEELQRQELQRIRELEQGKADRRGYNPELDSAFAVSGDNNGYAAQSGPQAPNVQYRQGQNIQNPNMQYGAQNIQNPNIQYNGQQIQSPNMQYAGQNVQNENMQFAAQGNQYAGQQYSNISDDQGEEQLRETTRRQRSGNSDERPARQERIARQERQTKQERSARQERPENKRKRTFDPDQAVSDEEFISSYEDDGYDSHDDYDYDREEKSSRKRSSEKTSGRSHDRHDDRHRDSRHSDDGDGKKPKRKKKNPVVKFFGRLIFILLIIFLIFGLAIGNVTKRFKHIDTEVSKRPGAMKKGVVNVLLIGQDARDGESGQRTDSIILMSINTKKNNVSMTSIMRDTYVDIPGYGGDRINAAYVYGGIDLLDQTIEENFDITIDGNAMVDFDGFLEAMTAVGNLDIALTAEEAEYMNANPGFGSNNDASDEVWNLTEGVNSLTPNQLLAYSRIRYIGNSDWDRTERQRKVISAAVSRVKHGHFISGYQMATKAAPSITTDIKTWGMMRVAFGILTGGDMKSHIIPVEDTYYGDYIDGMDVLVPDLEQNKAYLQKYINGEE